MLAHFHQVPFYVVTPISSINTQMDTGDEIRIEERPAAELTLFNGLFVTEHLEDGPCHPLCYIDKVTAPLGCKVWNPAFDVTPARLITGILTEKGCYHPEELNAVIDAWK